MSGRDLRQRGGPIAADVHTVLTAVGKAAADAEISRRGHRALDGIELLLRAAQGEDRAQQAGGIGMCWRVDCSTT